MSSDLTFITNEKGETLENRFSLLIKHTDFFDCLVGYFYASGFYTLIESLKSTEKIRVLIGISTNPETFKSIRESQEIEITASSKQVKNARALKAYTHYMIIQALLVPQLIESFKRTRKKMERA